MGAEAADLKISMESPAAWERRLTITVPAERVAKERRATADRVSRRLRLPGFRKGKVPVAVVEKRYGPAIEQEALEKVMGDAYREAVQKEGLQPITQAAIGRIDYSAGSDLTFDVGFEVQPEVELNRIGGFLVTREKEPVDEAQIDRVIDRLRDEQAVWHPVEAERPLAGDMVGVEITPLDAGEVAEVPKPRSYELVLGEGQALPPIEDAIRTLAPGEENDFTVELPEDPEQPAGAMKQHAIRVRVLEVKRAERPAADDEFARAAGDFADMEALRSRIREDLDREAEREAERDVRRRLIGQIMEANPFDVPASMVDQYLASVVPSQEGQDEARMQEMRASVRPAAEHALRRLLVIQRIADTESLHATADEVESRIASIAERMGRPAAELKAQLRKNGRLAEIEEEITEDKVFGYLMTLSDIQQKAAQA